MKRFILIIAAACLAALAVFPFCMSGSRAASEAQAAPLQSVTAPGQDAPADTGETRDIVTGIRIFNPIIKHDFFNYYYEDALGNSLKKGDAPFIPREHLPDVRIYDTSGIAFPGRIAYIHTIKPEPKVWDIRVPDEIDGVNMFVFRYLDDPAAFAKSYDTLLDKSLGSGFALKEFDIFEDAKDCELTSVSVDPERYRALRVLEYNGKTIWASVGSRPLDVRKSGKRYIVLSDGGVDYVTLDKNGIVTDHYSKGFSPAVYYPFKLRDKPEYPIEEGRLLTENVARIKYKNGSIAHFKIKITKNDFDKDAGKLPRSDKAYGSIGFPSVIWRKGEDAGGYGSDHLAAWDLRSPAEEPVYDNGFGKSAVRMPAPYSAGDGAKSGGAGLAAAPGVPAHSGTARRYVTEERDVDPILMKKKLAAGWIADNRNNQIRRMYVAVSLPAGTGKETRLKLAKDIVDHSGMLISSNYEYMKDCGEDILGIPPDPSETVTLGSWPQSGDKKEPIEWIVLARLGRNRLYVISKYVLERRVFDESDKDVKWKDCSLRRWLNDGFYKAAFSAEEKKRILVSDVATRENKMERYNDPQVITYTKDKLFIPCGEEINNFFYHQRGCAPTKHARDRKLGVDERTGFAYWWLRGVGFGSAVATSHSPASTFEKPNSDFAGVRPMMWITAE